ncbi:Inner membrane protein YjcH [Rhodocyclaceae bacterium]|nr:Inner membrane protein YjcH [Rhodocyclaceae bacterium]
MAASSGYLLGKEIMSSAMYERMRANPKFRQLVSTRGRFAWTLAAIVLTMFYGFVMTVAFNPQVLGRPVTEGSMLTFGVAAELFMFIFFWLLTAFYVRRANTEFDAISQEIVNEAWQETRQ